MEPLVIMIHERETGNVSHDNSKTSRAKCTFCQNKAPVVTLSIYGGIVTKRFGYVLPESDEETLEN